LIYHLQHLKSIVKHSLNLFEIIIGNDLLKVFLLFLNNLVKKKAF